MHTERANLKTGMLIGVILLLAIIGGGIALIKIDRSGDQGNGLPESFTYDLEKHKKIDPALIHYQQTAEIPVAIDEARAIALGPEDRICVAGDQLVQVYDREGAEQSQIALEGRPGCLAVGHAEHAFPGRIYVGMGDHVEVYDANGTRKAAWEGLGQRAVLTSIALGEQQVFVADAGNKIVLRYDTAGKLLGRIGKRDENRNIPGFVIPSPYFDVAMAPDGLLRVVNPGGHRIEAFTTDGDLEFAWGKPTVNIEGFCGCCNPVNMALLPDGRVVTAEKGLPRVKVYDAEGRFVCVVAGPEVLAPTATATEETRNGHKLLAVDVAADSRGRILVLDPAAGCVRIFEHKNTHTHGAAEPQMGSGQRAVGRKPEFRPNGWTSRRACPARRSRSVPENQVFAGLQ